MTTTLSVLTKDDISLVDALSDFATLGDRPAYAILYSPGKCILAIFTKGTLQTSGGQHVDVQDVFEARLFHESAELRWWNDPSSERHRRSAILAEGEVSLDGWRQEGSIAVIDTIPQSYLLWGEGTGKTDREWSELATARIGALMVPVSGVAKKQRVQLLAQEYVVEADYGNAVIFDERLIKLEISNA